MQVNHANNLSKAAAALLATHATGAKGCVAYATLLAKVGPSQSASAGASECLPLLNSETLPGVCVKQKGDAVTRSLLLQSRLDNT